MTTTTKNTNAIVRFMPIFEWLPRYDKAWLTSDLIAGLSVWALMVPQALGYASISGVPVHYGLYAAMLALLVYPLFATSRHVITGPSSTIAAVTGAAVAMSGIVDPMDAVPIVALITIIAGLLYIALALLRMGWISHFLSESVLTGFIFGIGIEVVIGQLGKLTGSSESGETAWQKLFSWLQGLSDLNPATTILGVSLLALLIALKLFAPKVPGALVAVALGIGAAMVLPLEDLGVALTGEVPTGLPRPALPSLELLTQNIAVILPAAIGVLLVGLSESLAAARQYAAKYHYDIDANQELLAQGMANTASGLFQGINVAGSLSKSSVNDASGAKTELSSIAQGGFVVLTLLFLAPLFANLPSTVLAAVVIQAVAFGMWKIAAMGRLASLSRLDFWLAMAALLGVLTFGTLQGVFIGVFLSLLWLIWRTSHPAVPQLGRLEDDGSYHSVESHPDAKTVSGLAIVRLDGPLFFATAGPLRERIRELTRDVVPSIAGVVFDLEGTDLVDLQGADELSDIATELEEEGITLYLARGKAAVLDDLRRWGTLDVIPEERVFSNVHTAVRAAQAADWSPTPTPEQ